MSTKTLKRGFARNMPWLPSGAVVFLGSLDSGSAVPGGMQRILARMQPICGCDAGSIRFLASETRVIRETGYLCLGREAVVEGVGDAARSWYHTVPPMGEYPSVINKPGGKTVKGTLVVDEEAYRRILADFLARRDAPGFSGLIVDLEHHSEIPDGSTEAAAWALDMQRRPDGIWTRWDKTDLGNVVIGGRYKFRSPAFDLETVPGARDRYRPVALSSIGLTNTPHFKNLAPSLNRAGNEEGMDMLQRLQALLKLPATADQDAVCRAVEALVSKSDADGQTLAKAQTRVEELEKAELNRAADAFVSLHKGRIKDEAAMRALYLKDPETCKGMFGALKDQSTTAADKPRMLGRDARTPAGEAATGGVNRSAERAKVIASIQLRDGCKRTTAVCKAQRERPDLYVKEEEKA